MTTQRIMRSLGRRTPWAFWGELPSGAGGPVKRWLQQRQYAPLRRARTLVAVGERARAAYRALIPGIPVLNQPYACELGEFAAAAARRPRNSAPVFLFCGQMIARKGIDLLLRAFAQLVAENIPATLELVGREAELPRYLAELPVHVRARITYAGFKAPADLPATFARADVFVLPSRHDGWGVVINQALGAGLPVIATDAVGAALDLVQPGVNGMRVPAGDVVALADAMRRFAASPELRQACGAAATADAARLSPDHAAAFWEEMARQNAPIA
jgi:glycosyltransferase involved in cell wall biosynthesis